jgi:hypothetical protein
MTGVATVVCLVAALLTALVSGLAAARNRATTKTDLVFAGLTEVAVLVYVAFRGIDLIGGHKTSGLVVVIAYLVGLVLIMPIVAALSWAEPTRWGGIILASGALVTCVMFARINELWAVHG